MYKCVKKVKEPNKSNFILKKIRHSSLSFFEARRSVTSVCKGQWVSFAKLVVARVGCFVVVNVSMMMCIMNGFLWKFFLCLECL